MVSWPVWKQTLTTSVRGRETEQSAIVTEKYQQVIYVEYNIADYNSIDYFLNMFYDSIGVHSHWSFALLL